MQYLEYKMDAGPGGMHTPYWVDDGGYWPNAANHTMVGCTKNNQEHKIPDSVTKLTAAEVETRQVAIHDAKAMLKMDPDGVTMTEMTEAEVRAQIQAWVTSHS